MGLSANAVMTEQMPTIAAAVNSIFGDEADLSASSSYSLTDLAARSQKKSVDEDVEPMPTSALEAMKWLSKHGDRDEKDLFLEKYLDNLLAVENANTARQWEKMMSDTSIQRQVSDMKKAGINPILASNVGGASVPTIGAANVSNNSAYATSKHIREEQANRETSFLASIIGSIFGFIGGLFGAGINSAGRVAAAGVTRSSTSSNVNYNVR